MHLCSKTPWPSLSINRKFLYQSRKIGRNSLNDYVWVVWQHWIIHAYLIALYEGYIASWCIKGGDACLGCLSSNTKGWVLFMWRTKTHKQLQRCLNLPNLLIIFIIFVSSLAKLHILCLCPSSLLLLHWGLWCWSEISASTHLSLRLLPICGPWLVSPSNSI